MGHPRLHDALQGRGVRCWLRADWNVCGETKTLSSDTKTPTPPKEGGMGHPAMTFTNRWTAGFGCEKQLSVAGCQLSVRFFPRFRQRRAKGWGNCQRTRANERARAEGAGGGSAEPGRVSAERGVRCWEREAVLAACWSFDCRDERTHTSQNLACMGHPQGQAGAVAAGGGLYGLGAGCAEV